MKNQAKNAQINLDYIEIITIHSTDIHTSIDLCDTVTGKPYTINILNSELIAMLSKKIADHITFRNMVEQQKLLFDDNQEETEDFM